MKLQLQLQQSVVTLQPDPAAKHGCTGVQELPVGGRLPWDHIDVGLAPGFLAREYRRALAGRLSPPCGKAVARFVNFGGTPKADYQTSLQILVSPGPFKGDDKPIIVED